MSDSATERTGADCFVDALESYGVTHVFGNPGTTELPVVEAIGESDLSYVLGLHEDVAVGMAGGYASARRYHAHHDGSITPVGVANLHVAPGLAHGLGNLYAASVAGTPLVVTAGNHSTDFRHEDPILGGDLVAMADQFTKWSAEVLSVDALPTMLRRAFRVALTPPTGPVFLALPLDVTLAETDARPEPLGAIPNAGSGDPVQLDRAAELLVEAEEPAMVIGDHVARSGTDAVESAVDLAEAAGLRVHGEILASEISYPSAHDQWVSYIPPSEEIARAHMDADALLFAGVSTNTTLTRHDEDLVAPGTTCIHVGDDVWQLGKNHRADAAVVGDPGLVLSELAERVRERLPDEVRDRRAAAARAERERVSSRTERIGAPREDDPLPSKGELAEALRSAAPDAFVVDESVTAKYALLSRWHLDAEQYLSNKGGGLGYGLPAAVGAAVAERQSGRDRPVVGFVGDGSYLYYPHSIYSAVRRELDLTVVIPDNRNYRILKENTLDLLGGAEDEYEFPGMDFDPPVDIPANAESHGATGRLVGPNDDLPAALEAAVAESGPSVVDVLVHD